MAISELIRHPRLYQVAAAGQAADAVACVEPVPYIARCLDDVGYPPDQRWIFPVVKAASAVGLALAPHYPALTRLTTVMLTTYFSLAVGSHIRARDIGLNCAAATSLLAFYGTLAVTGPPRADRTV
ncbi:MAG: DoxX family protein [Gordonia amarae]